MQDKLFANPPGGIPGQDQIIGKRASFSHCYAIIPASSLRDCVTSRLPGWEKSRMWVLARPLSGFAETFSHYIVEVEGGGGSDRPEYMDGVESVLFVASGALDLKYNTAHAKLTPGSYVYLAANEAWCIRNLWTGTATFHWIRKNYEAVRGVRAPESFVLSEADVQPEAMPGTRGNWTTTRFVNPDDVSHDMHVNIVTLQPGARIPFAEMHVMEHGVYVLEGRALYLLNQDWVEVEQGDYMWLRAFCPQACIAGGPGPFRYLLYKDVNRHASFEAGPGRRRRP